MKVTKKYLAYLTVLAIGCGWLGVDCLSSGSSIPAVEAATVAATPEKPAVNQSMPAEMGDEPAIANRLDELMRQRGLISRAATDGFAVPAAFRPAVAVQAKSRSRAVDATKKFLASHKLNSVMVAGRASNALIDGRLLQLGDQIDGFKLIEISQNAVVLSNGSGKVSLNFGSQSASLSTATIDRR